MRSIWYRSLCLVAVIVIAVAGAWARGRENKSSDPPIVTDPPPSPWEGTCPFDPAGCPPNDPSDGGEPPGGGGSCGPVLVPLYAPSAGDPVNLAMGVEAYRPADDLVVYNPYGPAAVWRRHYYTGLAVRGQQSPGLPVGWVHTYDLTLQVDTSDPAVWKRLSLTYPYGAAEVLVPQLDPQGQPTGVLQPPSGTPYIVRGVPSSTPGVWQSVTVTWRDGTQWRFVPFGSSLYVLGAITNRVGRSITFSWDSARRLTAVTDASSNTVLLSLTYQPVGSGVVLLTAVTDAYGRQVQYQYSVPAWLSVWCLTWVSQVVPAGTSNPPMRYSYNYVPYSSTQPLLSSISVPSPTGTGIATSTLLYANGRVVARVDANGNRTEYDYSTSGQTAVRVKDPLGNVVYEWTQYFNEFRRNTGTADANGKRVTIAYEDPANPARPTRITDRDGKVTTYTYDQYGNVLTVTNPRGVVTHYTYDYSVFPLGRLVRVQEGNKPPTTYTYYEPSGLVQSVTSPKPGSLSGEVVTTSYTYDSLGNVLMVSAPGNNATPTIVTTYNYMQDGGYTQPAKVGQPLTVTDNLGNVTHYRYDARGNRVLVVDANGNQTDFVYNIVDQVVEVQYPPTGQQGSGRSRTVNGYLYPGGPLMSVTEYDEGAMRFARCSMRMEKRGSCCRARGAQRWCRMGMTRRIG